MNDKTLTSEEQIALNPPPPMPRATEPAQAQEVFVDGYLSSTTISGMVKLVFFSQQHNVETNAQELRVVLRLTMPLGVAVGVHGALGAHIEQTQASMAEPHIAK